jgi:hypothetical protein
VFGDPSRVHALNLDILPGALPGSVVVIVLFNVATIKQRLMYYQDSSRICSSAKFQIVALSS